MEKLVNILLCAVVGGTLSNLGVNITDWRFWVIVGCLCGANICGYISAMKTRI